MLRAAPDRIERVVLAPQTSLAARQASGLEHCFAAVGKEATQIGAIVTGALDRPDACAAGVACGEAQRRRVAASARFHHGLCHDRSRTSGNDRERVLIAVRVDTDHVVQLVCKHPDRSSDS